MSDGSLGIVLELVNDLDVAASRFRKDSELLALQSNPRSLVEVSNTLFNALSVALMAAETTGGLVDPTIGNALIPRGYDRDFAEVAADGPALTIHLGRVPGWRAIGLDPRRHTVSIPKGVNIDLGPPPRQRVPTAPPLR